MTQISRTSPKFKNKDEDFNNDLTFTRFFTLVYQNVQRKKKMSEHLALKLSIHAQKLLKITILAQLMSHRSHLS